MANQNQYIKPPSKDNKNINNDAEYIKPPSKKEAEYVKPPTIEETTNQNVTYDNKSKDEFIDPYKNPSYFSTPKMGIRFYINSYIIISSIFII